MVAVLGAAASLAAWLPRWGLWMAVKTIQTVRGGMQGYPSRCGPSDRAHARCIKLTGRLAWLGRPQPAAC